MRAALLFVNARQTFFTQSEIERFLQTLDCRLDASQAAFDGFLPTLSALLKEHDAVFLVSPADGFPPAKPVCSAALFERLHVPVGPDGEPRGVLRLPVGDVEGYLIESRSQAICLLPDEAPLLPTMLGQAAGPLCEKFGLTRRAQPSPPAPRFEDALREEYGDVY